jgi:TonB family protein
MIFAGVMGKNYPKDDLLLGLAGSIAAHAILLFTAFLLPSLVPSRPVRLFYTTVKLVDPGDLAPGREGAQKAGPGVRSRETAKKTARRIAPPPIVPVRRLRMQEPLPETGLRKIEPQEVPDVPKAEGPPVEKTVEQLMPQVSREPARKTGAAAGPSRDEDKSALERSGGLGERAAASDGGLSGPPGADASESDAIGLARRLYYAEVWDAIRRQWALPKTLVNAKDLEAILVIVVRRDGRILDIQFEKRSGNSLFDDSVVRAVQKANPLPRFPEIYSPPREEIGVRFRPQDIL